MGSYSESASNKGFIRCSECDYKLPHHASNCKLNMDRPINRRELIRIVAALAGGASLGVVLNILGVRALSEQVSVSPQQLDLQGESETLGTGTGSYTTP